MEGEEELPNSTHRVTYCNTSMIWRRGGSPAASSQYITPRPGTTI